MYDQTIALDLFDKIKLVSSPPDAETFQCIEDNKKHVIPLLLEELELFNNDFSYVEKQGDDYIRHIVSLYLLAYFRVQSAYPLFIRLISITDERLIPLMGEVFTESIGRLLASVCHGNLYLIKKIIENSNLNPWIRAGALDSLMVLWKEDLLDRDELVAYLKWLMQAKLERKSSYVWDAIALIAYDLHPKGLEDELREGIERKLIAPIVLDESSLTRGIKENLVDVIKNKQNIVDGYIKEPIKELTWWLYPDDEALDKGIDYAAMAVPIVDKKVIPGERSIPVGWRVENNGIKTKKVGRNDPCPCRSGKKFKKCCALN